MGMSPTGFFAGKGEGKTFKRSDVKDRTDSEGRVFDSKYEMLAYLAIKDVVPGGFLQLQEKFSLLSKKKIGTRGATESIREMTWSADFMVGPPRLHSEAPLSDDRLVIDIKGNATPQFTVKLKVFKWRYEHIPLVVNVNTKAKMAAFVETVRQHCINHKWITNH